MYNVIEDELCDEDYSTNQKLKILESHGIEVIGFNESNITCYSDCKKENILTIENDINAIRDFLGY